MKFEVIFYLKDRELSRHQFSIKAAAELGCGVQFAMKKFWQERPDIGLGDHGISLKIQKAEEVAPYLACSAA